jgi:hypothetical protein
MSITFPAVVINYITFTAKRWGHFPTISYLNGATAGSEVVTVDSSLNINIQIQDGVTTNLQIKTAIEATANSLTGLSAGDLVSVVITGGHNSDTNTTVKSAALVGGTAAIKASLTIGHLIYTAQTAGVAGNSIRVKYTSGSSLTISVSTDDITIQLKNDGSSTNALIAAAVAASSPANALVSTKSDGLAMSFIPTVAMASAFQSLAGGADAAVASVGLQDLTYTSVATGSSKNGKTITYTTGATAGAEVVSVDVNGNVTVQIQNGVSTATNIKTALDLVAAFTTPYAVTISGTGSTAQKTVNAAPMTGGAGLNDQGFYSDQSITALTSSFVEFTYPFVSRVITLANDETSGTKVVAFSFDGVNIHGTLAFAQAITWDVTTGNAIWLKYVTGAPAYRLIVKGD